MYATPRTKFSRQIIVTVIGFAMVLAAVVAGALLGDAATPDSPAGAVVVVTDEPDTGLVGGGTAGGSGGVTGTGGMMVGSAGGSGGIAGK